MWRRKRVEGTSEPEAELAASRVSVNSGEECDHPALADARLHQGEHADALTDALGAQAVTVGSNVFVSHRAPDLASSAGRRLLAHELTHVVQQRQFGPRVQRFTTGERPQIADNLAAMMAVIEALATASSNGDQVNMDAFVRRAGGQTATAGLPDSLRSAEPPLPNGLTVRYLFTRRCGLVDMRHLIQLMYISWFLDSGVHNQSARGATRRGIEHERTSEAASRFSGEDLTSNALGAWTATRLAVLPQRDDLVARLRDTLQRCAPVDFGALSATSQAAIVTFYAARTSTGEPLNQNTTAVALIPVIPELAGTDRSFPFDLDDADPNRATIGGRAFDTGAAGLTGDGWSGDSEIRSFVSVQRDEVIRDIPSAEKVRLGARLLRGWVSDEDLDAFERIYRLGDAVAQAGLRAAADAVTLSDLGQRMRLRIMVAGP